MYAIVGVDSISTRLTTMNTIDFINDNDLKEPGRYGIGPYGNFLWHPCYGSAAVHAHFSVFTVLPGISAAGVLVAGGPAQA